MSELHKKIIMVMCLIREKNDKDNQDNKYYLWTWNGADNLWTQQNARYSHTKADHVLTRQTFFLMRLVCVHITYVGSMNTNLFFVVS